MPVKTDNDLDGHPPSGPTPSLDTPAGNALTGEIPLVNTISDDTTVAAELATEPITARSPAPESSGPKTAVKRGRLSTNALSNVFSFALSLLIGIWFTPYLIHNLGVAAAGLIPLIGTITAYMGIITLGLNSSVSRFLTIALEQGDTRRANRVFNTSLFGSMVMGLLLLGPCLWVAFHIDRIIRIPPGYEPQTRMLMICTVGAFLLNELIAPFEVSTYCQNRFDLRSIGKIIEQLTRAGTVVLLFHLATPQTWHIGAGVVLATIFSGIYAIPLWRKLTPTLHIRPRDFDRSMVGELTQTGAWIIVSQIGVMLFLNIDLLVANKVLGPTAAGQYAAILLWSTLLRSLASTISSVFGPTITYLVARNDIEGVIHQSRRAVRLLGLALALPIGFICGFSKPLLLVWLGPSFVQFAPLMSLATVHLCLNLAYMPLHFVSQATNNVRLPGLVTLGMGLMNMALALFLSGPVGWGVYGLAASSAIVLGLRNLLFTPVYAAQLLGASKTTFMKEIVPLSSTTLALCVLGWFLAPLLSITNWFSLIGTAAVVALVYSFIAYTVLLNGEERRQAQAVLSPLAKKLGRRN
jgi:membrane protein EpsK